MAKRELLQMCQTYNPKKHGIAGWWVSPKYDGECAYWDGGITRGMLKSEVPWANTDKDDRYRATQYATSLWSRYGHAIHALPEWLDTLPLVPLHGELWLRRGIGGRSELMSITKRLEPTYKWFNILFMVHSMPMYHEVFCDSEINITNYKKTFNGIIPWIEKKTGFPTFEEHLKYRTMYHRLKSYCDPSARINLRTVHQEPLPHQTSKAEERLYQRFDEEISLGGEGLIIRNPESMWTPTRSSNILKMKECNDMEGTVVGCTTGVGKLTGMMGALILKLDSGVQFELSGFTDAERKLKTLPSEVVRPELWARDYPGKKCPSFIQPAQFLHGTRVTFRYRDLSADGVPQEARYWRIR